MFRFYSGGKDHFHRLTAPGRAMQCDVNVKFEVTLHEQLRYRGTLQYSKLHSVTHLDTMVKSTMTGTVPSSGRSGTTAAMAPNEQTEEEHCKLEQQRPGRLDHPAWCVVWTV